MWSGVNNVIHTNKSGKFVARMSKRSSDEFEPQPGSSRDPDTGPGDDDDNEGTGSSPKKARPTIPENEALSDLAPEMVEEVLYNRTF